MLTHFLTPNFQGDSPLVLENLKQFNIIVGRNNSGKSRLFRRICMESLSDPTNLICSRFVLPDNLLGSREFTRNHQKVNKLIQILDNNIEGIDLVDELIRVLKKTDLKENPLNIKYKDERSLNVLLCGDGVQKLVFIAFCLFLSQDGILLIDDFEIHLHTEAMKGVVRWIIEQCKELNIQLFISTHSLEIVDEFAFSGEEDNLSFYRLEAIDSMQCDGKRLKRMREQGIDVRW